MSYVYPLSTKELSRNSFKGDRMFQVKLEFGNVGFCGGGGGGGGGKGTGVPKEKSSRSNDENQQQTQPCQR